MVRSKRFSLFLKPLYQFVVSKTDLLIGNLDFHFNFLKALLLLIFKYLDSKILNFLFWNLLSFILILILDFDFIVLFINFAKFKTFIFCLVLGPKFHGPANFCPCLEQSFSARAKYPVSGSITCCQGLVASGLLRIKSLLE